MYYNEHLVKMSYPTLKGRVWLLAVPGGSIWATYLEKEVGWCPHMTHKHLPYPGHSPEKVETNSPISGGPVAPAPWVGKWACRGKQPPRMITYGCIPVV